MYIGSAKSPSIADVVRKAAAHLEGREIVTSPPQAPRRGFSPRPRPVPAPQAAREKADE